MLDTNFWNENLGPNFWVENYTIRVWKIFKLVGMHWNSSKTSASVRRRYGWYCHGFYNPFINVWVNVLENVVQPRNRDLFHWITIFRTSITSTNSVVYVYDGGMTIVGWFVEFGNFHSRIIYFWSEILVLIFQMKN